MRRFRNTASTWLLIVLAGPAVAADIDFSAGQRHWAFQPLRTALVPRVQDKAWPTTALDALVLAKLEARGLTPAPAAEPRTLLRRIYFDLIGLPPSPAETEAFVAACQASTGSPSTIPPLVIEKVVDRLLASPHYGERWGRHWLDVARYADSKDGVLMYGDDRIRPYAYTYRDYVIRAFNDDVPVDRFVHEQLAADMLQPKVEPHRLAALGLLTLGRMFDNNIHDVIDDRIDTVTRGLLGLTVSCARCHDHKYDPIAQADYYALYGVFANCEPPIELPLLEPVAANVAATTFEKQAAAKRLEIRKFLDDQYSLLLETARQRAGDYLVHAATTAPDPLETAIFFLSLAPTDLRPPMVAAWRRFLVNRVTADDPVFAPWHAVMTGTDSEVPSRIAEKRRVWEARPTGVDIGQVNPLVRKALEAAAPASRAEFARIYGDLLRRVYEDAKKTPPRPPSESAGATPASLLDAKARAQLLEIVTSPDSPAFFPKSRTRDQMSRSEKDAFGGKLQELDRMAVKAPQAPPRAMAVVDTETIHEPRLFLRGNPAAPGERVPRQFLRVLSGVPSPTFTHGSGRLELAQAITNHPLFARVFVNRMWLHHFGEPLVENPSDFGARTARPVQHDVLDYLALTLQRNGWSQKKLHREIVLSRVYQQASADRSDCRTLDPENRLLWRAQRRRLDLEAMRDSALAISGRLDSTAFGRPVDIAGDPLNRRRTAYGMVDRQSLPALFRAFDFASPDHTVERRPSTTVPQQALFAMNAPFMFEQAKALAARTATEPDAAQRVRALYRQVFGRGPTTQEMRLGIAFVNLAVNPPEGNLDRWAQFAQVLLLTNEVQFVE